jgi:hypothetical protein
MKADDAEGLKELEGQSTQQEEMVAEQARDTGMRRELDRGVL